jgi:predicted SPOUT superfamily RNA methylase MTH1
MIGKKTLRNKDEDNYNSDESLSPKKNSDKKILNTKEKENINKSKINKKGFNIKELKAHIKNKFNNNINEDNKNNSNNKPTYTKLDESDSDSESSHSKNEIQNRKDSNESNENKLPKSISSINPKKEKVHPQFTKSTKVNYTLSVLIPSSIVDNAQSKELRTYLIGEIARTLGIFKISEVIIFHDKLKDNSKDYINYFIKNLQYLETPQYLRKTLFPMSEDLKLSGLMNPLESQHHLRKDEWSPYREGCVLDRPVSGDYSWVNIGLNKDCKINQKLPPKTRVTVKLNESNFNPKLKYYTGSLVSMSEPFIKNGTYWGYVVRVCETYNDIFNNSIYKEGYDFIIGTSDKGENYRNADFSKKKDFKHCLIIFGGISGIEGMMIDDEHNKLNSSENIAKNFDLYLNTCMNQGLRTIRTEEAILISLAVIKPELDKIKEIDY